MIYLVFFKELRKKPLLPKVVPALEALSETYGISVVIFSGGIEKDKPELNGVLLHDINLWPSFKNTEGTSIAVNITNSFKKVLGSQFKQNESLGIINFITPDNKGKVPDSSARILYDNACHKDTYPVDIGVILAGPSPIKEATLKSIRKATSKFICVTVANRYFANESICEEFIAVGVSKFTDDMVTSGVLDFCVPVEHHRRIEDGIGVAVGMIASLLWRIKQIG